MIGDIYGMIRPPIWGGLRLSMEEGGPPIEYFAFCPNMYGESLIYGACLISTYELCLLASTRAFCWPLSGKFFLMPY